MAALTNAQALAYIASYRDLSDALGADADAGRRHFEQFGQAEGRQISFSPLRYIASYADLIRSIGTDAEAGARHFISFGRAEGRVASFDALRYTASHADLVRAFGTDGDAAAAHYIRFGFNEGRPTTLFNARDYVAANADLIRAGLHNDLAEATRHFLRFGINEQRATSGFDAVAYLLSNPDLGAAGIGAAGALDHWLRFGAREGRTGDAPFGREQASHALVNTQAVDRLEAAGDRDWFAVTLQAGITSVISINAAGGGGGTLANGDLYLYDASGRLVASDLDSGPGSDARLAYTAAQTGTFYAEVRSAGGATGTYTLAVPPSAPAVSRTFTDGELAPGTRVQGSANPNDVVFMFTTPSLNQATFSGFELLEVDRFVLTNQSAGTITFDMSGSTGLTSLEIDGGRNGAIFDKVNSLASLSMTRFRENAPSTTADVAVRYADSIAAGEGTQVTLNLDNVFLDDLTIGSVSNGRSGVEHLHINFNSIVVLNDLISDAAKLSFAGFGPLTIQNPLSSSVVEIVSANLSPVLNLNASFSPGLRFTVSNAQDNQGSVTLVTGAGNDRITTAGGFDTITTGAGEDIVSTGAGFDRIIVGPNISPGDRFDGGADGAALVVGGRAHTDLDFTNAVNISILEASDQSTITIGSAAQAAGIRMVNLISFAASTLDASAYTVGLRVVGGGTWGDDIITTGSGDDVVIAGIGNQTINLGGGDDQLSGSSEFDIIDGGSGRDTIVSATGVADLSRITGVERFEVVDSLTFTRGNAPSAGPIEVVGTAPATIVLGASLVANQSFTITGAAFHSTTLVKLNMGVANPFTFQGGVNSDTLQIAGGDLIPEVSFNGGDGADRLVLSGAITDAGFGRLTSVESVTSTTPLNMVLGAAAQTAGIVDIGSPMAGNNRLVVGSGFTKALRIDTKAIGDNVFDASQSSAVVTFVGHSSFLQEGDTLKGGSSSADVLELSYVHQHRGLNVWTPIPQMSLVNLSGVERINVTATSESHRTIDAGPIILDTAASDLNGTTFQRIVVTEANFFSSSSATPAFAPVDASLATANIFISGSSDLKLGSGNDRVEIIPIKQFNQLGTSYITPFAPKVSTGAGSDRILGSEAGDLIDAGAGGDRIYGAAGTDTLTGGSEADSFIYLGFSEGGDTIADFQSGVDVIDVRRIADQGQLIGNAIRFAGNAADLAAAQALLSPGDNTLDAVFQQDQKILWFDNGDGVLNASDLKIDLTRVALLTGADVMAGATVATDPDLLANFLANDEPQVPPSAVEPFQTGSGLGLTPGSDFF